MDIDEFETDEFIEVIPTEEVEDQDAEEYSPET